MLLERVNEHFANSIKVKINSADVLPSKIVKAGQMIVECFLTGNKLFTCGNGGSCSDSLHFSSELLNKYNRERPALPVIALTADVATITSISNDYNYHEIFSKQIEALGVSGDLLIVLTTSGNSQNILKAVSMAHEKKVKVLAITGKDGGDLAGMLNPDDLELRVPSEVTAHIQETHITIIHSLCDLIDEQLFA